MTNRATGVGSMPGDDFADAVQIVLGEVGDLPFLPELPARGIHAGMTARALATISELGVDLQPAGWRLTDASGLDHRRAVSLLNRDLDMLEEVRPARLETIKVQLAGPWTLAATVERPRGDKVIGDYGARRDLAQALAEGVLRHVQDVRRRLSPDRVVLQIDEPALPSVLAGGVPTASGFHRHRAVDAPEAAQAIDWVIEEVAASGVETVLHCCAAAIPWKVLNGTRLDAVSFDLAQLAPHDLDELGAWVDAGRQVWPGVVPTEQAAQPPTASEVTRKVLAWWSAVGFSDPEKVPATTLTPACGLASASVPAARALLALVAEAAQNLSVEQGKMER
ncbi:MAG: methionine synthase [Nocardioidaceae bacterium]